MIKYKQYTVNVIVVFSYLNDNAEYSAKINIVVKYSKKLKKYTIHRFINIFRRYIY